MNFTARIVPSEDQASRLSCRARTANMGADEQKPHGWPSLRASQYKITKPAGYRRLGKCGGCAWRVHGLIRGGLFGRCPKHKRVGSVFFTLEPLVGYTNTTMFLDQSTNSLVRTFACIPRGQAFLATLPCVDIAQASQISTSQHDATLGLQFVLASPVQCSHIQFQHR